MYSEPAVLELVGLIYDAAGDARLWAPFLEKLGQKLQAFPSTLFIQNLANQEESTVASVGSDPAYARSYEEYYREKNVYLIQGHPLLESGNICLDQALCPRKEAVRSEFYNDWIAPQKFSDAVFAVILRERYWLSLLCLDRSKGAKPFSEEDALLLQALMPHLQRAVQIHQRITRLETEKKAATDALDRWAMGVILLDASGSVL